MSKIRECRLSDVSHRNVNLLDYEEEIVTIIEATVPGKRPKVYKDHFTTDPLTRGEAIRVGQALSQHSSLNVYGKTVHTFRLFDGKNCETNDDEITNTREANDECKKEIGE